VGGWLLPRAFAFLEAFFRETGSAGGAARLAEVRRDIEATGSYRHTPLELEWGARVAWRNSNRCVGRLPWRSLTVFDHRELHEPEEIEGALRDYLRFATNGGVIRPAIAIFPPADPGTGGGIRIWNSKLVRYAGYPGADGRVTGDPAEVDFTRACQALGWRGAEGRFDLLPVVISVPGRAPHWFEWRDDEALQVPLRHPEFPWFAELGLRWYAVPAISDMVLEMGGIEYPAAPFNGWFMGTEIGARNLGDEGRYDLLPEVAERMGLDRGDRSRLWRDRALVELNTAVLWSFQEDGVRITDHHAASREFLHFVEWEARQGRAVQADWSWIVPPLSGSATGVFHREFENRVESPGFFLTRPAWRPVEESPPEARGAECPFHIEARRAREVEDAGEAGVGEGCPLGAGGMVGRGDADPRAGSR